MKSEKAVGPTIRLDAGVTPDAKVLVQDGAGLILMEISDAIVSCAAGHRMLGSLREEAGHIFEYLKEWVQRNNDRVATCRVAVDQGRVLILCAPRIGQYDFELGDRLADLNMELTKAFRLFSFDSLQVPVEGFGGFMDVAGEQAPHAK